MKSGLVVFMLMMLLLSTAAATVASNVMPPVKGCRSKCSNVDIPYPFGIDSNCFLPGFALSCNDTGNNIHKPFFYNVEFINISLSLGQAYIYNYISWQCYNSTFKKTSSSEWSFGLTGTPCRLSDTRNKFFTVGCDTLAYIEVAKNAEDDYSTGCVSVCHDSKSLSDGSCSGMGCCQTSIPKGMDDLLQCVLRPRFQQLLCMAVQSLQLCCFGRGKVVQFQNVLCHFRRV